LSSHDDLASVWMRSVDALMWQNLGTVQVCLVLDLNIFGDDRKSSNPAPLANGALPSDYTAVDITVGADTGACEEGRALDEVAWADFAVGTDNNVGANDR